MHPVALTSDIPQAALRRARIVVWVLTDYFGAGRRTDALRIMLPRSANLSDTGR
jgi:hypothetical protein